MEALSEILVNIASQSPIIALLLYFSYRDRQDAQKRINDKNELIEEYRKRDWQRLDRVENSNRAN